MRFINPRTTATALVLAVLAVAGCSTHGGSSGSASNNAPVTVTTPSAAASAIQQAETPDQAANAVLKAAGYSTSSKLPEFGHYAAGIDLTATARYMVVVTFKTAQEATAVKTYYDKNPQTGVTVTSGTENGVSYVAFKINSVKDGKAALKNLDHALRNSAQGSL